MDKTRMDDLRELVIDRLRESLHGKTFDLIEGQTPHIYHMLGLADLDEVPGPKHRQNSILEPSHEFWDDYYKEITTESAAEDEIITAIESLQATGHLRITYPRGNDAGICYVEVDTLSVDSADNDTIDDTTKHQMKDFLMIALEELEREEYQTAREFIGEVIEMIDNE